MRTERELALRAKWIKINLEETFLRELKKNLMRSRGVKWSDMLELIVYQEMFISLLTHTWISSMDSKLRANNSISPTELITSLLVTNKISITSPKISKTYKWNILATESLINKSMKKTAKP